MNQAPNPLSSDSTKDTDDFGLKTIRSCYNRWRNGYAGESFSQRTLRFNKNRLYAAGKQPTEQFRDIVKVDGQIPIINLDYSPLAIAVPLLNSKKDRYMERIESIRCRTSGPVSTTKKKKDKDAARFKLNYGPAIKDLQSNSGMQLEEFSDSDPKSARELDIQFETTYQQREEIIMQMGMELVFDQNSWSDIIKDRLLDDIFNCGYSVTLTELDGNGWIKTPWVKPETFITSYSEFTDFNDWQWQGQVRSISIAEIRLRYKDKISEQELFDLASRSTGKYGNATDWNFEWSDGFIGALARPYDNFNVEAVDLYYKTLYNLTYERVTNSFGKDRLKDVDKIREKAEYEKSKPYYVAYHGVWIIDTEYVLEWGLAKNMLKSNNNLVDVRSPYTIHMPNNNKCRNTPLVETMIPLIDLIQNIHMQTQKIIAMTAPDGFNIDIMGLSNMDMGEGVGIISPMQAFGLYLQTGNQYFMSTDGDSDQRQLPPITPQNHQYSNKLEQLEAQWQAAYAKLQRITGDNNLASGAITNQATANSTLNDAREIADNASNYAYKSYLQVFKGTAKNVELLLLDKFFLLDDSFEGYTTVLGEDDIAYMRSIGVDGVSDLMFDTKIEVALDSSDQQKWDRRIEIALQQKEITLADVAELELIDDATYRSFMLAQKVKEKQAADMKQAAANAQNNTQQATAAAQAKAQGDMQLEQQQHANKLQQLQIQQDGKAKDEDYKFSSILKIEVAKAILAKPDSKLEDIPDFIWAGLNITNDAQKKLMIGAIQQLSAQNQQFAQQQQAQQQQGAQQQQAQQSQQGQPGGEQPQQQAAA